MATQSTCSVHLFQRFHVFVVLVEALDVDILSRTIQQQISQPFSFLEPLYIYDGRGFTLPHCLGNQLFSPVVLNRSVVPAQSVMFHRQPGYALSVRFAEKIPRLGIFEDVMRENKPLSESGKLLHDEGISADDETLQIHERWRGHDVEK